MGYQKWFVHRTLRPIAFGGLVQTTITGVADYPINRDVLKSQAVIAVSKKHGSYLLPAAYPEGGRSIRPTQRATAWWPAPA